MKKNLTPESIASEISTEEQTGSAEHQIRLEKMQAMRKAGIEPWPAGKEVTATCHQVVDEFCEGCEEPEKKIYQVAGRLMTFREHGKTAFGHIQDRSGRLQIYIKKDDIGEAAFTHLQHYIDIGDIVWVAGYSFKTKTGEITLHATQISLLSKSLHPLPEKFHGLTDVETMYRQRYLDLISNVDTRERFRKRSLIVREMRNFLDSYDFLEVETPMLHPIPGGAAARPFVTHHNALDTELYLRIAPELYLKRLVVGGFERVYEINRNFRNEGVSTRHNPEFTMLEFYMAYEDYHFAMTLIEQLFKKIAQDVCKNTTVQFGEYTLDFDRPFQRLSMKQAVMQYANCSEKEIDSNIDEILSKNDITVANKHASWGEKLYALFEALVEQQLVQPTFITEFPVEVSPLAKRDVKNPALAARFELFIARMEISNGFNELNDPLDQAERFREQVKARSSGDTEAHHYDADFVQALEYGLPPTVGVGIGIDRLVMLMTNATSIKDVILFPTLKKKE